VATLKTRDDNSSPNFSWIGTLSLAHIAKNENRINDVIIKLIVLTKEDALPNLAIFCEIELL